MKKAIVTLAVCALAVISFGRKANATDSCLELTGPSCPVDGFGTLRFKGKLPVKAGKTIPINGRFCGLGSGTGTATVDSVGYLLEVGINIFCDGSQGQFELFWDLDPALPGAGFNPNGGYGYGDYDSYGTSGSCNAKIVTCTPDF